MSRRCRLPLAIFFLLSCAPHAARAATLSRELEQRLPTLREGEGLRVVLQFADRVDLSRFRDGRKEAPDLIRALRATSARSQGRALSFLAARGATDVRSFWINNSIAVRATGPLLLELTGFEEIATIDVDQPVGFTDGGPAPGAVQAVEWNLTITGIDQVWSTFGLDGAGIVVGSMDTGFDPAHPALAGKWRGGTNSWTDIINGLPAPYDDHGHGTHTIGTMVGGDGPGPFATDIGVCYGATFISAKVLDATNSFSDASIVIAGAQWMLDPDGDPQTNDFPHVINNSWFFFSAIYTGFHSTIAAWRAAGIVPVFCIGNFGPTAQTTRVPGSYNNTLGIGATTSADAIASFSSRGPSPSGSTWFPADRRKPDLSAPGDFVLSSVPGGGYQQWSGTSMASPHVAGTVALMLQANPDLTFDEIRQTLEASAVDLGAVGYDYDFGYGRLNALAALNQVVGVPVAAPAPRALVVAPNPFSSGVRFLAGSPAGPVALDLFDVQGRRVWTATAAPGEPIVWDGRDRNGLPLPAGAYWARATSGGLRWTQRVVRLD